MSGDVDVLLVSTSEELTGEHEERLERELAWLRAWYGKCGLRDGRRLVLERRGGAER